MQSLVIPATLPCMVDVPRQCYGPCHAELSRPNLQTLFLSEITLFLWVQVNVPGRAVSEAQVAALHAVLDRAHGLTTGQKIVGFAGSVVNTVLVVGALRMNRGLVGSKCNMICKAISPNSTTYLS